MESCEFRKRCSFVNETMVGMPLTTLKLVERYCEGDIAKCLIHEFANTDGIDKVPKYVYPNDTFESTSWYNEQVLNM